MGITTIFSPVLLTPPLLVLGALAYLEIVVALAVIQVGIQVLLAEVQPSHLLVVEVVAVRLPMQVGMAALVVADTVAPLLVQVHQAKEMLARRGLTMGHHEAVVAQDHKAG